MWLKKKKMMVVVMAMVMVMVVLLMMISATCHLRMAEWQPHCSDCLHGTCLRSSSAKCRKFSLQN